MSDDRTRHRLARRCLTLNLVGGAGLIQAILPGFAHAQITDRDPGDSPGRGRGTGVTDRDSRDRPNQGRGTTGRTDADPRDSPGRGRGGPPASVTDRDPGDSPGRGRGNPGYTGRTDADSGDSPGRGRR